MESSRNAGGRRMIRRHDDPVPTDIVNVTARALVEVSSEQDLYPIDNAFDGRDGPGGSCWIASAHGAQSIVLWFAQPIESLRAVVIESEQRSDTCTQRIAIAGWCAGAAEPFEGAPRVFDYSPYGPSFHRHEWPVRARDLSRLCVRVTPAPGRRLASLTSIVLRAEPS